jgi:hypothetical protein
VRRFPWRLPFGKAKRHNGLSFGKSIHKLGVSKMSAVILQQSKRARPSLDSSEARLFKQGAERRLGRLDWVGCYATHWEVVIYEQHDLWEACFFTRDLYHEHVTGPSFHEVRRRAEERIDLLESDHTWCSSQHSRERIFHA